jgi:hypothetical protein
MLFGHLGRANVKADISIDSFKPLTTVQFKGALGTKVYVFK